MVKSFVKEDAQSLDDALEKIGFNAVPLPQLEDFYTKAFDKAIFTIAKPLAKKGIGFEPFVYTKSDYEELQRALRATMEALSECEANGGIDEEEIDGLLAAHPIMERLNR